jgi:phosphatidylinositol alpha 1,6-mannosyltransferase
VNPRPPRVALFADSFHEVNGVGLTCRMLEDYAQRWGCPMLSVHAGPRTERARAGSVERYELRSSPWRLNLEQDLKFDLLFGRHWTGLRTAMVEFQPDVVHVTGPNHAGLLGTLLAHHLRVPVVASWHTNLHEYAAQRMRSYAPEAVARRAKAASLKLLTWYYRTARVLLAPHDGLREMLEDQTGRPCRLMRRGVDCEVFDSRRRARQDNAVVVGYVGRLSPEKSVRRLRGVERALVGAGVKEFRIEIAGHGSEGAWLRENVQRLRDHGVQRGEALACVYANFDVFAFPSETDTYGNVVQEAMASGVPCVVTSEGGPARIVTHGLDGIVARGGREFGEAVALLASDAELRRRMGLEARRTAEGASWDAVFECVYAAYGEALGAPESRRAAAGRAA